MEVKEAIRKNRSIRRFYQDIEIGSDILVSLVEAARLSPSSRNIQPIKYYLSNERDTNSDIFKTVKWAAYLTDWKGPKEGERPSAYIIQIHDQNISADYSCDHGITAQSILLQAVELGYGGCIIASVDKKALTKIITLPENMSIINVIALGHPKETVVVDDLENGEYKYWRDSDQVHHVPKRKTSELILNFGIEPCK